MASSYGGKGAKGFAKLDDPPPAHQSFDPRPAGIVLPHQTIVNRQKTKKWAHAEPANYEGDDWGDDKDWNWDFDPEQDFSYGPSGFGWERVSQTKFENPYAWPNMVEEFIIPGPTPSDIADDLADDLEDKNISFSTTSTRGSLLATVESPSIPPATRSPKLVRSKRRPLSHRQDPEDFSPSVMVRKLRHNSPASPINSTRTKFPARKHSLSTTKGPAVSEIRRLSRVPSPIQYIFPANVYRQAEGRKRQREEERSENIPAIEPTGGDRSLLSMSSSLGIASQRKAGQRSSTDSSRNSGKRQQRRHPGSAASDFLVFSNSFVPILDLHQPVLEASSGNSPCVHIAKSNEIGPELSELHEARVCRICLQAEPRTLLSAATSMNRPVSTDKIAPEVMKAPHPKEHGLTSIRKRLEQSVSSGSPPWFPAFIPELHALQIHDNKEIIKGTEFSHKEYATREAVPFITTKQLGHGSWGVVDEVRPTNGEQGVVLARKVIQLRGVARKRVLPLIQKEVAILKELKHENIIQVVCTYETTSVPRQFGILLSPVGEEDLLHYMERLGENGCSERDITNLKNWRYCLASAVEYIHSKSIRHKDIKPSNAICKGEDIFLTDFGSAHEFNTGLTSSTEGYAAGVTKMYSAPEVIEEDRRGRSADIFSLGCVFAEMTTVIYGRKVEDFHDFRSEPDPNEPERLTICYYATVHRLSDWFATDIGEEITAFSLISHMMNNDRKSRPKAEEVRQKLLIELAPTATRVLN